MVSGRSFLNISYADDVATAGIAIILALLRTPNLGRVHVLGRSRASASEASQWHTLPGQATTEQILAVRSWDPEKRGHGDGNVMGCRVRAVPVTSPPQSLARRGATSRTKMVKDSMLDHEIHPHSSDQYTQTTRTFRFSAHALLRHVLAFATC